MERERAVGLWLGVLRQPRSRHRKSELPRVGRRARRPNGGPRRAERVPRKISQVFLWRACRLSDCRQVLCTGRGDWIRTSDRSLPKMLGREDAHGPRRRRITVLHAYYVAAVLSQVRATRRNGARSSSVVVRMRRTSVVYGRSHTGRLRGCERGAGVRSPQLPSSSAVTPARAMLRPIFFAPRGSVPVRGCARIVGIMGRRTRERSRRRSPRRRSHP
jgi:hypothetical protein